MKFLVSGLLLFLSTNVMCQEDDFTGIKLMFWNVENAFDIHDDPATDDDDFLPMGLMRWNEARYRKKINDIYKTIAAAGEWTAPALVGFCEIENRGILEDLLSDTQLSRYEYGIVHEDSPDERGIDVCLIYRQDLLEVISHRYIAPDGRSKTGLGTRTILYSVLGFRDDTIHLFLNHWPSRSGGILREDQMRMELASTVNRLTDSLLSARIGRVKIIVAGDFNSNPGEEQIRLLTATGKLHRMINLTERFSDEGIGSYRFQGTWEMLDQVIVSDYFMKSAEGLYTTKKSASIFSPFFLLSKDPNYPGNMPMPMYRGRRYHGGVSDHLPVLLDCNLWPQTLQE